MGLAEVTEAAASPEVDEEEGEVGELDRLEVWGMRGGERLEVGVRDDFEALSADGDDDWLEAELDDDICSCTTGVGRTSWELCEDCCFAGKVRAWLSSELDVDWAGAG